MCGIAGFLAGSKILSAASLSNLAENMANAIAHRGPDGKGVWLDQELGVAIAHRRLSILDLSPTGAQPMKSSNGRYVVTFNGEIYNFNDLRIRLEKNNHVAWRGNSDTEVLVEAVSAWGVEGALNQFIGMFALVIWDCAERTLYLARDRLGEKPLYYGWLGDTFLFGSEIKALKCHPSWCGEIDRGSIAEYMRCGYIAAPRSIFSDVYKLPAGTFAVIGPEDRRARHIRHQVYWSLESAVRRGASEPFSGSELEAQNELEALLTDSVKHQMVADVPLGAFLSGGIDSSTIVALMQSQSRLPVKTFTVGFREEGFDESAIAKLVARHLGTQHTELLVTSEDALAVIPLLPSIYDEPFSDSSQIPTFLVSKLASESVKVCLSGDGGDELFGGYSHYFRARQLDAATKFIPPSVARVLARVIKATPPSLIDAPLRFLPKKYAQWPLGDRLYKVADMLNDMSSGTPMHDNLLAHWRYTDNLIVGGNGTSTAPMRADFAGTLIQQMMFLDTTSYLSEDILVKVDRSAMAVSLETRVPLLDHRVVELAWRFPLKIKVKGRVGKRILRNLLYKYVPAEVVERPKKGFSVPIGQWLKGALKEWAEDLLDESSLRKDDFLSPLPIRKKWSEHLSGDRNWQYHLWDVLMFQAWLENVRS